MLEDYKVTMFKKSTEWVDREIAVISNSRHIDPSDRREKLPILNKFKADISWILNI